jgi:hypothetical protein
VGYKRHGLPVIAQPGAIRHGVYQNIGLIWLLAVRLFMTFA